MGKKIAIILGIATGVAAVAMAFGKTSKKSKTLSENKGKRSNNFAESDQDDDSKLNYV